MEKTNLKLAQDYASILKKERGVAKTEFVAFYSALVTAYSTLAIAEKIYEDLPEISEDGYRKVAAFLSGNVPSDGFTDGWYDKGLDGADQQKHWERGREEG